MKRDLRSKLSTHHSFDMSEYIWGERFELGGVDFDLDDEDQEKRTTPAASKVETKKVLPPRRAYPEARE